MIEGYVYFILDRENNRVKIGFTKREPIKRLKQLQTGSSSVLELLHYVDANGFVTEKYYHKLFANDRLRDNGEWFNYSYHIKSVVTNSKYLKNNK